MSKDDVQSLVELTEEACKTSHDAAELAKRALDTSTQNGKTAAEKFAEAERAIKDVTEKVAALDRKVVFPEYDPRRLKYNRSQRSFEKLMRSKPSGHGDLAALVEELERASTLAALVRMFETGVRGKEVSWADLKQKEVVERSEERPVHRFEELCNEFARVLGINEKRALDTQTTGEGIEWTPTLLGTSLMAKMLLARRATGMIETVQMPSAAWYWPYVTAFPSFYRVTETTGLPSNPWATSAVTEGYASAKPTASRLFTARKIRCVEFVSFEYTVDSIAAAMNDLLSALATGAELAKETAMFNGDRSSTHLDADIVGIGSSGVAAETVIDGLRNWYLAQSNTSYPVTATPTTVDLLNAIALMTKEYAADIQNQAIFCSVLGSIHLYANKDCRNLSDLGPNAVIVAGQIAEVLGRPIVIAGTMRDDITDNGVNESGGDNTKTAILIAHLSRWKWGTRPAAPADIERLPLTDQNAFVVHERFDLQFVGADADKSVVAVHGVPTTISQP